MENSNLLDWSKLSGFITIALLISGFGFYFGFKNAEAEAIADSNLETSLTNSETNSIQNAEERLSTIDPESTQPNQAQDGINQAISDSEIFWILPNQEPICPDDYPIKGKFTGDINKFYTKENTFYGRVKPHLCFASEDYALETAGFIKSF